MSDLLIREVPDEVLEALSEKAKADGLNRMEWLRTQLVRIAAQPVVKRSYAFKAYGPEAAFAQIKRLDGGYVQRGARNCNEEQFNAYQMAVNYVERNEPGDREQAHDLLSKHFETVFETSK